MTYTLWKEFSFEAAHSLPHLPESHKCFQLHGHHYVFRLYVEGETLEPTLGWLTDLGGLLKAAGDLVVETLDHQHLNTIPGLENPTVEVLAGWIRELVSKTQLGGGMPTQNCWLVAVEVQETLGTGVRLAWS